MIYRVIADGGLNVRSGPGTSYEIISSLTSGDTLISPDPTGWLPVLLEDDTIGWCRAKYLTIASEEPTPTPPSVEPIWIQWARKQIGQREVPGPKSNPVIQAWYHLTTLDPEYWIDATAWCAVFVNAALMLNNIKTIRSARAVDWLKFGTPVSTPQKGDIVVFDWGNGNHHVAFYMDYAGGGQIDCLGGNQSDAVNIKPFPKSAVMGYRRVL